MRPVDFVPIKDMPLPVWADIQAKADERELDPAGMIQLMNFAWDLLSPDSHDMLEQLFVETRLAHAMALLPTPPCPN
jgi:hypothetical protein